jgi:hypothetical protein
MSEAGCVLRPVHVLANHMAIQIVQKGLGLRSNVNMFFVPESTNKC